MKNIVTIGGSTSKKSINKLLAEYTGALIKDVTMIKVDLNDFTMPLFSVDIESELGLPKETTRLNSIFEKADGFIVSLAEHNGAYSAAFKNGFDWLSRIETKVWRGKPMLLLSTSPGMRGGLNVLELARGTFPRMGAKLIGSMPFPSFYDNFKENKIVNDELRIKLDEFIVSFKEEI